MELNDVMLSFLKPLKPYSENDPLIRIMRERLKKWGQLKPILVNNFVDNIIVDGNKLWVALVKNNGPTSSVPVLSLGIAQKDVWKYHTLLNSRLSVFGRDIDNYIDPYLDVLRCKINESLNVAVHLEGESSQKEVEELREILDNVIYDEMDID